MRRRRFLAASALSAASAASALPLGLAPRACRAGEPSSQPSGKDGPRGALARDLIDLRIYTFASAAKMQAFDDFLAAAAIPALKRLGVGPVGAFKLLGADNPQAEIPPEGTVLYVLIPHRSAETFISMNERLAADAAFGEAGSSILMAPKSDPAFVRFQSTLLVSFDRCPRVEVPTKASTRLLQLRIYESHSVERHLRKVEMFDGGGEIAIFRRSAMHPVFFGAALAGAKLPNLTYMLGFEDRAAMDKAWDAFRKDPDWIRIKDDPWYKDTVSGITNLILRPTPSSEV